MNEDKIANAAFYVGKLLDILETITPEEAQVLSNRVSRMNSTTPGADLVIGGIVNALDSF
jgi:hypothetical protein